MELEAMNVFNQLHKPTPIPSLLFPQKRQPLSQMGHILVV